MALNPTDTAFTGSVPELYDRLLVPLIFEPYAGDMASRVAAARPRHVLEVAAGTGVVTRRLSETLEGSCEIVATDLQASMLQRAQSVGTARPVQWQVADAMALPFHDASFDAVACQFGAMFFPDKVHAFAEARRVLRPGGLLVFSVWDAIEHNEFADVLTQALAALFPQEPPRFLARVPHGYHEPDAISGDLHAAGFQEPRIDVFASRSRADAASVPAIAYCQGTPLRREIEAHGSERLFDATRAAEEAIAARFGQGQVDGKIQALIVTVTSPTLSGG